MENLESHRIPHLPNSIYYLPSFLSPHEESLLLSRIPPNRWIHLSNRRLQAHPTQLTPNNTLLSSTPLPTWLASPYVERIQALGVFDWGGKAGINHCLVNEYLPGQGIMGHEGSF
jgi:alkylated DNA repair protein alkB family protein 6